MRYRLTPAAKFDIDQIWSHIEEHSGNADIADRLTQNLYEHILLLAKYPHLGRDRSADLGGGYRSFTVEEYVIVYSLEPESLLIVVRVVHGRRDLDAIFGH